MDPVERIAWELAKFTEGRVGLQFDDVNTDLPWDATHATDRTGASDSAYIRVRYDWPTDADITCGGAK